MCTHHPIVWSKTARAQPLWDALERIVPDVRERVVDVVQEKIKYVEKQVEVEKVVEGARSRGLEASRVDPSAAAHVQPSARPAFVCVCCARSACAK